MLLMMMLKTCIFRLLTPPGTPLFPSLEMGSQKTVMNQNGTREANQSAVKSRVRTIVGSLLVGLYFIVNVYIFSMF